MKIHMDALIDYLACPQLHRYRHIDKRDASVSIHGRENANSIDEAYTRALHKTIAYLFDTLREGTVPTLTMLKRKWGYVWVKPRADYEDVRFKEASWRDRHDEKRKQGWTKLKELHDHYSNAGWGTPIIVDYTYSVRIGSHELLGRIDLVRTVRSEIGRESIQLVEFLDDQRYSPFVHMRRDWRVTAAAYAFRQMMNVSEEEIVYHGIISGKLQKTVRGDEDFTQLERLLDQIESSINQGIYYPRFDDRCLTCPYEKFCEKGWYHAEDQKQ